ncbi:MAG: GNAT family protein [Legionella sp.]|nr:GNAT family protein [Legionella sp.]
MIENKSFYVKAISGDTLELEPITIQHSEELRSVANHECIWTYMPMRAYGQFFDAWLQDTLIKHQNHTQLTYIIRKKSDQTVVGGHSYYDIDVEHKRLEVGYSWLTPAAWGSRILHESLWLLFLNAFETWQMNRIQLAADPRNKRSYNILKKIGAIEEGLLREHMIHHNGLITDTVVFSILAREWPEVKKELGSRLRLY